MSILWLKSHKIFLLLLFCLPIVATIYSAIRSNGIDVDYYAIPIPHLPEALEGFRIVQISDLHLPKNIISIPQLVAVIQEQHPDIIVFTGDLVDRYANPKTCGLQQLCQQLTPIAPLYGVLGNHETGLRSTSLWRKTFQQCHIQVLQNQSTIITKQGESLALLGLADNIPYQESLFSHLKANPHIPKILLAHRPELWSSYCRDTNLIRPDLVFTGHAHGGQFRIPFIGGLYAPQQGFFPDYTSGLYTAQNGIKMIVSRGLGQSSLPIRLNNRIHLPVITLKSSVQAAGQP